MVGFYNELIFDASCIQAISPVRPIHGTKEPSVPMSATRSVSTSSILSTTTSTDTSTATAVTSYKLTTSNLQASSFVSGTSTPSFLFSTAPSTPLSSFECEGILHGIYTDNSGSVCHTLMSLTSSALAVMFKIIS